MGQHYYLAKGRWFFCLARLGLAHIYFLAAIPKFFNVNLFKATILAYYDFLPAALATALAITLPWLEFGLGLLLLMDSRRQTVYAGILTLLSCFYTLNALIFLNRWLPYGCGCFGFGEAGELGIGGVIRNVLITAVALLAFMGAKNGKANWRRTSAGG